MGFRAIEWLDDSSILKLIDQKALPQQVHYLELTTPAEIAGAIHDMTVRGAPAIGVAAAFGILQAARGAAGAGEDLQARLSEADAVLRAARPTAVNLSWALNRMRAVWSGAGDSEALLAALDREARRIEAEDIAVNRAISEQALKILPRKVTFFHHCNTGSLATVDLGTALGIIRSAHEAGHEVFAYIDETRPRLQGAKLSSFELLQFGVPHAIVVDGASAHIMRTRDVDIAVVGCDRVAANGDVANKIGTYNLALAAADNGVPFYVAAPMSTIDFSTATGDDIEIEERDDSEILAINGQSIAPDGAPAFNPAFDVTPHRLIAGIITEHGIARPPFAESLLAMKRAQETFLEESA
ncbi:probable translation initiation factor eIF-2B alpha subunit [Oceanicola granulosus HTCC2516]|uniref:Methylthioribose-1-phosphate isomerase n=1 Tax=Oceanicola granulosus (strain ATCC BAA-861 / DSM 15982 / KCTC 12143 / HTCC2516) TaxID=314256 RepID=Q2CJ95_OCEGH|nr:S-methyl-5-thioribose-1-phosphate isomerase [Oceanicola granulosus]EAR52705.1 probable translation initiation factor eIF-2B alpha subunit [Oceanicola granulosus HTCC2516]